jgi:signal transduction histidine kinase
MFSKNKYRLTETLSFRLTLYYLLIFSLSILAGFFFFNYLLSSSLHNELDQDLLSEVKELSLLLEKKGAHGVETAMMLEAESEGVDKLFARLMDLNGETIASTDDTHWKIGAGRKALNSISGGQKNFFETITVPEGEHMARVLYSRLGQDYIIQIMISMDGITKFLAVFRHTFIIIMGLMFILSTAVGWFMARRALKGVEEVTQTAIQVSDGKFDKRVKVTGHGEEIDRLSSTFNKMLEKLQTLITDIKDINDNVAHDLRSPVTRIRGIAETTLMASGADPEVEAMAGSIIEECDGLLIMINTMLDISEAEAGVSKLNISGINLSKIINEACELFQPVAEDKGIRVIQEIEEGVSIKADKEKIQRLVANLLDNALKYTDDNGTVTFTLKQDQNEVTASIKDTGIGISADDIPKIFNRFYRCDLSRSLQGTGLGLSLARAIVLAHHGTILVSSELDKGSTFTFSLPKTPF